MGTVNGIELDDVELVGDRLVLRRWRAEDAPAVARALAEPSMHAFLALPRPYDLQQARDFVTRTGHEGRGSGEGLGCAVVERGTGEVVGSAALRLGAEPDVGYWIAPHAQGRGFAAEACRMLAGWGFRTLELPRVTLSCDVANTASARTALLAGFRYEGTARAAATTTDEPPVRVDLARFARLADDDGEPIAASFPRLPSGGLTDGVIVLRGTGPDDAQGLCEADDEVSVGWGFTGVGLGQAECVRRTRRAGLDWLVGSTAMVTILDASGDYAGELVLRRSGPPQLAAIGYTVHPAHRGRGYTARALRLIAQWAFAEAGIARLELGAKVDNIASRRAAAGGGFEAEAVLPARLRNPDGSFSDEATFRRLRPTAEDEPAPTA